jgi:hypothetical protein
MEQVKPLGAPRCLRDPGLRGLSPFSALSRGLSLFSISITKPRGLSPFLFHRGNRRRGASGSVPIFGALGGPPSGVCPYFRFQSPNLGVCPRFHFIAEIGERCKLQDSFITSTILRLIRSRKAGQRLVPLPTMARRDLGLGLPSVTWLNISAGC